MIEIKSGPEQVLIFGVQLPEYSDELFNTLMEEMDLLTETAGGEPVAQVIQKLQNLSPRSNIGSGKVDEISELIDIYEIDLVISLNDLSPSTNQYLEDKWDVRVIDRVQLILDIFAMRAESREGKLQVELAQYEYLLPRIVGKGTQLSRLGGGIGTRGPGETQLETDRRHIRQRIHVLKKELDEIESHRERTRQRREKGREFSLALLGYTNAGKSTIIRALSQEETYVEDKLFATLDTKTRRFSINDHELFTITDTVGFIEELPTELIHAFKSTLEELYMNDLLIHVVDASHPARLIHEETVLNLLEDMELDRAPILTVYNKIDQAPKSFRPTLYPSVSISALEPEGIEKLKTAIWDECIKQADYYEEWLPSNQARELAELHENTIVESVKYDETEDKYIVTGYRRPLG